MPLTLMMQNKPMGARRRLVEYDPTQCCAVSVSSIRIGGDHDVGEAGRDGGDRGDSKMTVTLAEPAATEAMLKSLS